MKHSAYKHTNQVIVHWELIYFDDNAIEQQTQLPARSLCAQIESAN